MQIIYKQYINVVYICHYHNYIKLLRTILYLSLWSQYRDCECTHIIQHNLHQWQQLKLYMCSLQRYRCRHYNSVILNYRDILSRYGKLISILGSTLID